MRRALIFVLLIASHGLALWWGSRTPWRGPDSSSASAAGAWVQTGPELGRIIADYRIERAAAERRKEEDESTLEARIEQARGRIRPEDDLAGIVTETIGKGGIPSAEVLAAFGLWFERDPAAALKEIQEWITPGHWLFRGEIARHFQRQGFANLQHYLELAPKGNRLLLIAASEALLEQGSAGSALQAAAGLTRQRDRLGFLSYGWNAEKLRGHLGQAVGLFDKAGAVAFLGGLQIVPGGDFSALKEVARSAGFTTEALAALERNAKLSDWEGVEAVERERLARVREAPEFFAETIAKEQAERGGIGFLQTRDVVRGDGWKVVAPDLGEWQTEVARGTLDPAGLYEKLMESVPGSEGISQPLLNSAALASFLVDPAKTMEWLKQVRPDWMEVAEALVQATGSSSETVHCSEVYAASFGAYQELSESLLERLASSLLRQQSVDPAPYEAIYRQLPDGALKRKLDSKKKGGSQ
jgi:hypothetical protein